MINQPPNTFNFVQLPNENLKRKNFHFFIFFFFKLWVIWKIAFQKIRIRWYYLPSSSIMHCARENTKGFFFQVSVREMPVGIQPCENIKGYLIIQEQEGLASLYYSGSQDIEVAGAAVRDTVLPMTRSFTYRANGGENWIKRETKSHFFSFFRRRRF